jgi:hypothetical protein
MSFAAARRPRGDLVVIIEAENFPPAGSFKGDAAGAWRIRRRGYRCANQNGRVVRGPRGNLSKRAPVSSLRALVNLWEGLELHLAIPLDDACQP